MCEFSTIKYNPPQNRASVIRGEITSEEWACPRSSYGDNDYCIFHLPKEEQREEEISTQTIRERIISEINELDRYTNQLEFVGARLPGLVLDREQVFGVSDVTLDFTGAEIYGDISLEGFSGDCNIAFPFTQVFGAVAMADAAIEGSISCFHMVTEGNFSTTGATIDSDLDLGSTIIQGTLNLEGSTIGGDVIAQKALLIEGVRGSPVVRGDLRFDEAALACYVQSRTGNSPRGQIDGDCSFSEAYVGNSRDRSLEIAEMEVSGDLDLSGCTSFARVDANQIQVEGSVDATDHRFQAGIRLSGAKIGGDCTLIQTNGAEQRGVGTSWIDSLVPAGRYHLDGISVAGEFEFQVFRHWRPNGVVCLHGAEIGSGRLGQSKSAPMVYDLTEAAIGDTVLESDSSLNPFKQAVIDETDLSSFDFQAHHDDLADIDYRIDAGCHQYKQRARAAKFSNDHNSVVFRGFARQYLYSLMADDEFREAVASGAAPDSLIRTLLTPAEYDRVQSLPAIQKTGCSFFESSGLNLDIPVEMDKFESDFDLPFLLSNLLCTARDIESFLGSSSQNAQVTFLSNDHFQSLAERVSQQDWNAATTYSIANSTDEMPLQSPVGSAVPLILGICQKAQEFRTGPNLTEFEEVEGTAFLSRSSDAIYDTLSGYLLLEVFNREADDPLDVKEVIEAAVESLVDAEDLTDDEGESLSNSLGETILRVPLERLIARLPQYPETVRTDELASHPAFEPARLEEFALDAYCQSEIDHMPRELRTETTYLLARNAASDRGGNLAAGKLFIHECRARRSRHRERISTATTLRDRIKAGRKYASNWLLDKTSGYGESPENVVLASVGVVLSFAVLYHLLLPSPPYGTPVGNLVLSLESFVTLVHGGGVQLEDPAVRLLTETEGFIGAFLVAMFVFTLTRSVHR